MADDDNVDDNDSDLVKKLRAEIKERNKEIASLAEKAQVGEAAALRETFREAGVPDSAFKLMEAAAKSLDEVTPDTVRSLAEEAGLIADPAPTAGAGEIEAHEAIADAASDAPATPPDAVDRIRQASTREEVLALAAAEGLPPVMS